jgi:hypothetical protein
LNRITGDEFSFFGLEVELWRISNSPPAPKFNIVSKLNGWTKVESGAKQKLVVGELTDTRQLQLEYWTEFRRLMEAKGGLVRPTKPQAYHWQDFSIGRSGVYLETVANTRDKRIGMLLILGGEEAKTHFQLLYARRDEFERLIGEPLEWDEMPENKKSQIGLRWLGCDPLIRSDWPRQHEWLFDKLQLFHRTFSQAVKHLNADDRIMNGDVM